MYPFSNMLHRSSVRRELILVACFFVWTGSRSQDPAAKSIDETRGHFAGNSGTGSGESLVPAAFGIRTDLDGNSWNVEADGNIGRIGSTMVNSGLLLLINEEKFTGTQPSMSRDGREFVIHGIPLRDFPGLRVKRRVMLREKVGGLSYAELFYNGSSDAITLSVGLATNFSGNYKTFVSDRGRSEPVVPSELESAIIVVPGTSESPKAFLFTFSNAISPIKPTISAHNRYGLTCRFQLSLEPGETKILVHHVAQVIIPQSFDRRSLLKLSSPFSLDEMIPSLPEDWKSSIANVAPLPEESPEEALRHGGLEALGFSRGPRDLLVVGGDTRLPGEVVEDSMTVNSIHGDFEIALGRVAAIIGGKGGAKSASRIFLTDGQIITATIKAPGLTFSQAGGGTIKIEPGTFDQLLMAESASTGNWKDDSIALIETNGGDRIKIQNAGDFSLGFSTLWGDLKIGAENLVWMKPAGGNLPGYRVELRDGTRCYGVLTGAEISLTATEFGPVRLPSPALRHIFTGRSSIVESRERAGQKVAVQILSGDQRIVGTLTEKPIPVLTGGGVIKTAPSEIRKAARTDVSALAGGLLPGEAPVFEIERWDGGVIRGGVAAEVISVRAGGINWQIPVRDIEMFEIDSPLLTPEVATRIAGLVQQLGEADWSVREAATRELGAFGYLARPVLEHELEGNPDPEVARRIKLILENFN